MFFVIVVLFCWLLQLCLLMYQYSVQSRLAIVLGTQHISRWLVSIVLIYLFGTDKCQRLSVHTRRVRSHCNSFRAAHLCTA